MELTTLDALADEHQLERLDTIKVDVEGYELDVLRGGLATIARFRPIIYGEFNNQLMPQQGVSFADVWRVMEPLGYVACAFKGRLHLERRDPPPADMGNVVLIPHERVAEVRASGIAWTEPD